MQSSKKPSASLRSSRLRICTSLRTRNGRVRGRQSRERACPWQPDGSAHAGCASSRIRRIIDFRRRMIGSAVPAVTLEQRGMALTSNFLKVEMSAAREPNQLVDLEIGGATGGRSARAKFTPDYLIRRPAVCEAYNARNRRRRSRTMRQGRRHERCSG